MKDVYNLDKSAWYLRLLKYVYNVEYHDFSHICPLFWLTVFTVLLSPAILPLWFVGKLVIKGVKAVTRKRDADFQAWAEMYFHDVTVNAKTYDALKESNFWTSHRTRLYKFVYQYLRKVDYEKYSELSAIGYKKSNFAERMKIEKKESNKERINDILVYAKPVGRVLLYILLGAVALFAGFLVVKIILFIIAHSTPGNWWLVLKACIYVLVGLVVLGGLIIGAQSLNDDIKQGINNFGEKSWAVIRWPFIKIGIGFVLLGRFIKMIFSEYCPAIKWN